MTGSPERARQVVHVAMGGFALLLPYLAWWQAAALAGAAIGANMFLLPKLAGHRLYRAPEVARGFAAGILLYPTSVLLLILLFPRRPDIVGAAWAILAAGDGMATLVGHAAGGRPLPWNREKTVAGSLAFVVCGAVAGVFLAWWCRDAVSPVPPVWFVVGAPLTAAGVAAAVESIPVRLDDNVSVPAAAAAVLWLFSLVSADAARDAWPVVLASLPLAVLLNAMAAAAGYRAGTVSATGAICGAVIGAIVFVAAGWPGWTLLFLTFLSAIASSRLGLRRKTLLGIAQERGGRRGAGNAMANTGVAALAAAAAVLTPYEAAALVAFAAALVAGGSDTVASEIGKAWGRHAYIVHSWRNVAPGTSGAVSVEGTAAGFLAAVALASASLWLGLVPAGALVPIVLAATLGSFVESLLGATLEALGILNNDLLNFLNTAVAALAAVALASGGTT